MLMSQELEKEGVTNLREEDWYNSLVDDCLAIKVEREHAAREIVLMSKWEIGRRIYQENSEMERKNIYGQRIIENLSQDIGRSTTDLWNCLKFYKEYQEEIPEVPTLDEFAEKVMSKLPGGKETTWYKLTLQLGDRKGINPKKEKSSFKILDITQALREWMVSNGEEDENKIVQSIEQFKELLSKISE